MQVLELFEPCEDLPVVSYERAWADLRTLVFEHTAIDIDGPHPFEIRQAPVSGINRKMSGLVLYPRAVENMEQFAANAFCAVWGEISGAMAEDIQVNGWDAVSFARPLIEGKRRVH